MNRRQWIRKTNTTKLFHTVWIIVLALWGGSNSVYAEEVETWTSVSGVHLEARFVRIEGDLVVLQPTEGAPQSIRITQLVPADQVRARTLQEQAVKGTSDQPMAQLPGLDADPKSTRYAVYSCDTFDAEVLRTGVMMIYPKVNGTRVEPPIRLRTMIAAKEAQEHRRHWLIEEFVEFDRPQVDMATLSYTALAGGSEKATFRVDYTFKDGTVCLAAHILSPRQQTTIHWLRVEAFFAAHPKEKVD